MTTALAPTTAPAPLAERYGQIALAQLVESEHNPRTHFDSLKLAELAESIRQKGIVEPLVVRELDALGPDLMFEIVAGARRFRAAKLAGLETVPCIVRAYEDDDVLEIFVIENLQRDDLSPLEQARGFKQLLTANADRFTVATIASKVGMSTAWVWDRLKLMDLVPEAQQLLESGRITVGHGIVLSRLKPEDQERAIDPDGRGLWEHVGETLDLDDASYDRDPYQDLKPVSIRELDAWIARHVRFDVEHMAKAVPLQFEEVKQQVDEAVATQRGKRREVISITLETHVQADARDDQERTYGPGAWRRADGQQGSQQCLDSVLGLVVVGPQQGRAFDVCIARDTCRVHFAEVIRAKEEAAKARAEGDTKTATKVEKRQEQSWEKQQREREERRKVWEPLKEPVMAAAMDQVVGLTAWTPAQTRVMQEQREIIIDVDEAQRVLGKDWPTRLPAAALVTEIYRGQYVDGFDAFVSEVAKPLGLNIKPLQAARDAHSPKPEAQKAPATKTRGRK